MNSEWERKVKEFGESKSGVKGLLDSGITTIPSIFLHPPENLIHLTPSSTKFKIPVVDLSITQGSKVADQIRESLSTWGFFQVINHGIPIEVIEDSIKAFKSFHEQPMDVKNQYVWDEAVSYFTTANLLWSKALNWKDTVKLFTSPNLPELERIPSVCRKELIDWDERMKNLGETLMKLICESLNINPNRLKELSCLDMRKFGFHYYPYCPQPDLTMGLPPHRDRGILSLLLQNNLGGLQVKYRDEWVEVTPIHGAIIVNAGDLLQILSNNELQSVEHRVLANPCKEPRISVVVIFSPEKRGESDYYGPFTELSSPTKPAVYRNFTIPEILRQWQTDDYNSSIFEYLKLHGSENLKETV